MRVGASVRGSVPTLGSPRMMWISGVDNIYARVDTLDMKTTNAGRCTATTTNGKQCKRVAYTWAELGGMVLCAPHAFAEMGRRRNQ
jgi:hypothetical protein